MFSELECGICYRTYNACLRCPRELLCRHSFCESCLRTLSRPRETDEPITGAAIVCPLCRHVTPVNGEVRAELPVDEDVLSRLMDAGVPEGEEDPEDPEDEKEEGGQGQDDAEESDSSAGSGGDRVRGTLRKVWRKIIGKKAQRGGENGMTKDDMRDFAMMACYMF